MSKGQILIVIKTFEICHHQYKKWNITKYYCQKIIEILKKLKDKIWLQNKKDSL